MLSFSPNSRAFVANSVWDPDTYSVTNLFVNRSARTNKKVAEGFAQRDIDINDTDCFQFLEDKERVDVADAIKSEEREKMIAKERLYARPEDRRISGIGASAHFA